MRFTLRKYFSFQYRVLLAFVLLMSIPFTLTGYMAKDFAQTQRIEEKKSKLLAFTYILDAHLGPEGFEGLLRARNALSAPRDVKIAVLNTALTPITEEVSTSSPNLGLGYYSRALDAIVTYGPADSFGHTVGISIADTHPAHKVMLDGTYAVQAGTMVRGDILNAMLPLRRNGQVIGYVWANEPITDIEAESSLMARNIFMVMLLCGVLSVWLLFFFSRKTINDIESIVSGLRGMRTNLSQRIAPSSGELGEVVEAINGMATELGKITEENRLALSALQTVLSNVNSTVYVCDPHTKILVYTNEYLNKLYDRDDLQGKCCFEVLHNRTSVCPACPQTVLFADASNPLVTPLYREVHKGVVGRDFLMMDRLITWHDGKLLHMGVGTDLTERNARVHAESANLAQRRFLAHMSHELRTPMNGVLGMTRLAMAENPPPSQMRYLHTIQSSATLLLGIINDILDFSRIEADKLTLEPRAFNLREIIERVCALVRPGAEEKGLYFTVHVEEGVPEYVIGDGLRLSQVLLNLLGNAAKFTSTGGVTLKVSGSVPPSGACVGEATVEALGEVLLTFSVQDSGVGISLEQQQKLFNPFSQADISTSRQFGGTGLGLAISKALVELMGGAILVRSELNKGSEFYFSIALAEALDLPEEHASLRPWEDMRYEGHRFLLVEDNEINQEIAWALLNELGAEADTVCNGAEGLRAFLEHDYVLILMDVRMPVMDGLEATQRIRQSDKHDALTVPIIAMTANAMEEDRQASLDAGMNDHIAKPFEFEDFKRTLYRWIAEKKST